jgi:hypothetical protein
VCRSKHSSILSALDMARAPYPYTWIEWSTKCRPYAVENGKPIPDKLGALLQTNKTGSKGSFTLCWKHTTPEPGITLNPIGLIFDWDSKSLEPVVTQYAKSFGLKSPDLTALGEQRRIAIAANAIRNTRWAHLTHTPAEVEAILALELRAQVVPVDCCLPFLHKTQILPGTPVYEGYCSDLGGELPFIESFLLLLNSRNTIIEQRRDDFVRLNRARAKRARPPLKEFINTNIRLSRTQANRLGTPADRDAARPHLVRGHFKLRRSGCYFWTSHVRGRGQPVPRDYKVT